MPSVPTVDQVEKELAAEDDVDFDVALLHFSGGLPAGYSPVQLATSASIVQPGAMLHMIGYGLSKVDAQVKVVNGQQVYVPVPDQTTVGQLRETQVEVAQYNPDIRMIITDGHKTGVCNGDSGGPAFIQDMNGDVLQVGIAEAVSSPYCNSASMHTAIFPYLNWIKGMAAAMAKQAHPKPALVASLE
jgi:secreted trypsin-like serine protease